jgi:hypothetical protein
MDEYIENRGLTRGRLLKASAVAALAASAGGAGAALAGVAGAGAVTSALGKPRGGAAYLHRQTFVPLVGTDFRVHLPDTRPVRMKLIEAKQLRGPGESFSLLFRGQARAGVDGGIYRLEHPQLGGFELFVSPVGRGLKGLDLEAVINRIANVGGLSV